jgi:hypothetical protein
MFSCLSPGGGPKDEQAIYPATALPSGLPFIPNPKRAKLFICVALDVLDLSSIMIC